MAKYIDADVLLDIMGKTARELGTEDITDVDDMLDAMEKAMRKCVYVMPAADVEHICRGKWIEDDYGFFHCSECGFEWDESERTETYCPDCGAKNERVAFIDEEQEDE